MDMEKKLLENLTKAQKFILLLMSANNFETLKGNLWLQKEIFLLSNIYESLKEETKFEAYLIGPHSEVVEEEINDLQQVGLINKPALKLTELGKEIAMSIQNKVDKKKMEVISDLKRFLNDLSEDELLAFIYFSYPNMKKESIEFERIKKNRTLLAVRLFKKEKVSVGKASEIAGISVEDFIRLLKGKNISIH